MKPEIHSNISIAKEGVTPTAKYITIVHIDTASRYTYYATSQQMKKKKKTIFLSFVKSPVFYTVVSMELCFLFLGREDPTCLLPFPLGFPCFHLRLFCSCPKTLRFRRARSRRSEGESRQTMTTRMATRIIMLNEPILIAEGL